MAERKKLPIGVEFFREFKSDDFYYVDKTGFISELLRTRGTVKLIHETPEIRQEPEYGHA